MEKIYLKKKENQNNGLWMRSFYCCWKEEPLCTDTTHESERQSGRRQDMFYFEC